MRGVEELKKKKKELYWQKGDFGLGLNAMQVSNIKIVTCIKDEESGIPINSRWHLNWLLNDI